MTDTIRPDVYAELKRDRDYWRKKAKFHKSEMTRLTIEVARLNRALIDAQRDAARRLETDRVFS